MKKNIENKIKEILKNLGIEDVSFVVEHPVDFSHGDYSTNVAMVCAKKIGKNPRQLAEEMVAIFRQAQDEFPEIQEIQIAGPGFINFCLSREFFTNKIKEILEQKENWGKNEIHKGEKILVEHSSPNLFKPFHIGHAMNGTIGESIKRLAEFSGADVVAMSFPSDISLGVAKAIFIILEKHLEDGQIYKPHDIVLLGEAYVEGTKRYEEDESIQKRVKEISNNLYSKKDSIELKVYEECKKFNIEYFEHTTEMLGSKFDSYIYESEAGRVGEKIVNDNTPGIFTRSEGAVVYVPDESKKNINTTVFINSEGNPTYGAKDLGLLDLKFSRFDPDLSIFITDHQQISHFETVLDVAEKINKKWVEKSVHRTHGRMSFCGAKMSSRLGGVPLVKEMIDEIVGEIKLKRNDLSEEDLNAIAIAAIKFGVLRVMAGKNINFDPENSVSFEGDSGPYLQYGIVRAKSVIKKSNNLEKTDNNLNLDNLEITNFEKTICKFPSVVERSIEEWAPHHVVIYLLELTREFNSWYNNTKIIDENNPNMSYNLDVTKAFIQTMENGLWLLGIKVPDRM